MYLNCLSSSLNVLLHISLTLTWDVFKFHKQNDIESGKIGFNFNMRCI